MQNSLMYKMFLLSIFHLKILFLQIAINKFFSIQYCQLLKYSIHKQNNKILKDVYVKSEELSLL